MAKINLDRFGHIDTPTLILQNRNFDNLGKIAKYSDLYYKENFNSANELTFTVHKSLNKEENGLWDKIVDFKILYIPEYREKFEIRVSLDDSDHITKSVTSKSLCEAELGQIILRDIEINTETDITNPLYDERFPTLLYRNPDDFNNYDWSAEKYKEYTDDQKKETIRQGSLLHRLLEKAPHYTIGHVDDTLQQLKNVFQFSISNTDIYSELTGEISEQYHCIFLFDSMTRTVNVYDLYNTCHACGYRGDFVDTCPVCGSTEYSGAYGKDTAVLISRDNLANSISLETNSDSVKNCFYIEGGDDIITSAITSVNPNGSNYLYAFTDDMYADMPEDLAKKIKEYNKLYNDYTTSKEISIERYGESVSKYNNVVKYVNTVFQNDPDVNYAEIPLVFKGFPATTTAMYEAIDLYEFIKSGMLPTINISGESIENSMKSIIDGFAAGFTSLDTGKKILQNTISIYGFNESFTKNTIEDMIKRYAMAFYSKAYYDLDVEGTLGAYNSSTNKRTWTGTFTLTSLTEKDDNGNKITLTSDSVKLTVKDDTELYLRYMIMKIVEDADNLKNKDIISLEISEDDFKEQIKFYSYDELLNIQQCYQDCLGVVIGANIANNTDNKSLEKSYTKYLTKRIQILFNLINLRSTQIQYIKNMYFFDSSTLSSSGILQDIRQKILNELNFQKYLGNYWKTFCSYRREDSYSNSNYISDNLKTNSEVIKKAQELFEAASKELYKASHPEYTLSADINDLLILDDFKPFIQDFAVGNWIRLKIDNEVYRLRLLSYALSYAKIETLNVEFSTITKLINSYDDVANVISSVQSISSSYNSLLQQMDKNKETSKYVSDWVKEGFKATQTRFVNSDNQEFEQSQTGFLARRWDEILNDYEPYQLKLVHNGLYTTSNNWEDIDSGIGRFSYKDINGKIVDAYGVIAKTVYGALIAGEKLQIYNESGSVVINGDGITLDGGKITWKKKLSQDDITDLTKSLSDINGNIDDINKVIGDYDGTLSDLNKKIEDSKISDETMKQIESNTKTIGNFINLLGYQETTIADTYIISPAITSGYLNIENPNYGAVVVDPANVTNQNYIFAVKDKDKKVTLGIDTSGKLTIGDSGKGLIATSTDLTLGGLNYNYASGILNMTNARFIFANNGVNFGEIYNEPNADHNVLIINATGSNENDRNEIKIIGDTVTIDGGRNGTFISHVNVGDLENGWGTIYTRNKSMVFTNPASKTVGLYTNDVGTTNFRVPMADTSTVDLGSDQARWKDIYGKNGIITTSDRNQKFDISDLSERYEKFFLLLMPKSYMFKDGTSGRTHIGFIAQDVEDAMFEVGLTDLDFAGLCKNKIENEYDEDGNPMYSYSLRYDEFIAMNTYMIQKCLKEIKQLKGL